MEKALSAMSDELELEPSYFKEFLLLGKEQLENYWAMMADNTPYYYAAMVLHPNLQLAWFKKHWKKWLDWIQDVVNGMKEFYEFMAGLERDAVEEVVGVPRLQPRKVAEAVRLTWEKDRALRIIADSEADAFT